jgi:ankyrin repeat protein
VPTCRVTAAAFALGVAHMQGFGGSSLKTACFWFHTAGRQGHALSQALFAKFTADYHFGSLEQEKEARSWLQASASNGSKSALCQLKQQDGNLRNACLKKFRTFFWARAYDIPESWISTILSPNLDWLPSVPDATVLGRYDNSLLQCAAMMGVCSVAHAIIQTVKDSDTKSALINKKNSRGDTALLLVCKAGHASLAQDLLEAGADASLCNNNGENALHWLTSLDDDQIFDIAWALVSGGARVEQSARDDFELISKTASQYFHRSPPGTPLHRAADGANIVAIRTLLSLGADPVVESWMFTPLCRAAVARSSQAVEILLAETPSSYNVNKLYPNLSGRRELTTLNRAILINKTQIHYIDPGVHKDNAFQEIVSRLLDAGARPSEAPRSAPSAAGLCIWHGEISALEIILKHDEESRQRIISPGNDIEHNALHTAICMDDEHALDVLIMAGASLTSGLRMGLTGHMSPLQLCAKFLNQKTKCMERLLALGTDVDVCYDKEASDTTLYYAVQAGLLDTAEFLIAHGASLTKQTEKDSKGNVLANILYPSPGPIMLRAIELLSKSQIGIPLITNGLKHRTIFHSLCMQSAISKISIRRAEWQAIFEIFLQRFPDPTVLDIQDQDGKTALHLATYHAIPIAVELLLKAGARADIRDREGVTPIQASTEGHFEPIPAFGLFSARHMDIYLGQMRETQQLLLDCEEAESAWRSLQARPSMLIGTS